MKENKLIAEFMGYSPVSGVYVSRKDEFHIDEMQYDISWDWLMPVVEKIESDDRYDVEILQYGTRIRDNQKEIVNNVADISFDKKIDHTYDAVVRFIRENTDTERMMKIRIADMDRDSD